MGVWTQTLTDDEVMQTVRRTVKVSNISVQLVKLSSTFFYLLTIIFAALALSSKANKHIF